jgi:hypothetical protein
VAMAVRKALTDSFSAPVALASNVAEAGVQHGAFPVPALSVAEEGRRSAPCWHNCLELKEAAWSLHTATAACVKWHRSFQEHRCALAMHHMAQPVLRHLVRNSKQKQVAVAMATVHYCVVIAAPAMQLLYYSIDSV